MVVGFDHTIPNVAGLRDFRINGNAFDAVDNERPDAPKGGSCEPGIVMVAYDKNKNGRPDEDEWYEIAGSGNFTTKTEAWYSIAVENGNDTDVFRDYEMTYYRPTRKNPKRAPNQTTRWPTLPSRTIYAGPTIGATMSTR